MHPCSCLRTLVAYLSSFHLMQEESSTTFNPPITSSAVSPPPLVEIDSTKETKSSVDLKSKYVHDECCI